ncbi:unnamed protein product [Amoebophrya sp. A120]|nr:unnamed protein product [Amoebophrya sp. A120]|eukprot:GSA120T00001749001.1
MSRSRSSPGRQSLLIDLRTSCLARPFCSFALCTTSMLDSTTTSVWGQCVDDPSFRDDDGRPCSWWRGKLCNQARAIYGHTSDGETQLLCHCGDSCQQRSFCFTDACYDRATCALSSLAPPSSCSGQELQRLQKCNYGHQCASRFCCPTLKVCLTSAADVVSSIDMAVLENQLTRPGLRVVIGQEGTCSPAEVFAHPEQCLNHAGSGVVMKTKHDQARCGCKTSYLFQLYQNTWVPCPGAQPRCSKRANPNKFNVTTTLRVPMQLPAAFFNRTALQQDPLFRQALQTALLTTISGGISADNIVLTSVTLLDANGADLELQSFPPVVVLRRQLFQAEQARLRNAERESAETRASTLSSASTLATTREAVQKKKSQALTPAVSAKATIAHHIEEALKPQGEKPQHVGGSVSRLLSFVPVPVPANATRMLERKDVPARYLDGHGGSSATTVVHHFIDQDQDRDNINSRQRALVFAQMGLALSAKKSTPNSQELAACVSCAAQRMRFEERKQEQESLIEVQGPNAAALRNKRRTKDRQTRAHPAAASLFSFRALATSSTSPPLASSSVLFGLEFRNIATAWDALGVRNELRQISESSNFVSKLRLEIQDLALPARGDNLFALAVQSGSVTGPELVAGITGPVVEVAGASGSAAHGSGTASATGATSSGDDGLDVAEMTILIGVSLIAVFFLAFCYVYFRQGLFARWTSVPGTGDETSFPRSWLSGGSHIAVDPLFDPHNATHDEKLRGIGTSQMQGREDDDLKNIGQALTPTAEAYLRGLASAYPPLTDVVSDFGSPSKTTWRSGGEARTPTKYHANLSDMEARVEKLLATASRLGTPIGSAAPGTAALLDADLSDAEDTSRAAPHEAASSRRAAHVSIEDLTSPTPGNWVVVPPEPGDFDLVSHVVPTPPAPLPLAEPNITDHMHTSKNDSPYNYPEGSGSDDAISMRPTGDRSSAERASSSAVQSDFLPSRSLATQESDFFQFPQREKSLPTTPDAPPPLERTGVKESAAVWQDR